MLKAAAFFLLYNMFSCPTETAQSLKKLQITHSARFKTQSADATCLVILHVSPDILSMVSKLHPHPETDSMQDISFTTTTTPNH